MRDSPPEAYTVQGPDTLIALLNLEMFWILSICITKCVSNFWTKMGVVKDSNLRFKFQDLYDMELMLFHHLQEGL